jgi:ribosome-binding factor A
MGKQYGRRRKADGESVHFRSARLEELIREEINSVLEGEINDPRLDGTRVLAVELARDGSCARLWFDARAESAERALAGASGFLRSRLCDALELKRVPELRFRRDPGAWDATLEEEEETKVHSPGEEL